MNTGTQRSALLVKYIEQYKANPKSRVFAPLAETYRKLGMLKEAMEILRDGFKYHPSYQLAYVVLGNCYYDLEQYEKCHQTISPLIDSNKDNLVLNRLYADVCFKLGYLEQALESYKYLLYLNPRDSFVAAQIKLLEDDLFLKRDKTQRKIFDIDGGVEDWVNVDFADSKKEIPQRRKVDDPFITHTLIDLYCTQGHYERAIEILSKILEIHPSDKRTLEKLKDVTKQKELHLQKTTYESSKNKFENEPENKSQNKNDEHVDLLNMIDLKVKKSKLTLVEESEAVIQHSKAPQMIYKLEAFLRAIQNKAELSRG
jgi:tetratricopeptide (TPR) repeat protein